MNIIQIQPPANKNDVCFLFIFSHTSAFIQCNLNTLQYQLTWCKKHIIIINNLTVVSLFNYSDNVDGSFLKTIWFLNKYPILVQNC